MESSGEKSERKDTAPFLLKLFYRTGAFHRPDEFSSSNLPPHLSVYTWPSCTLTELSHHLAAATLLPDPAIGTRLAFRLIYPDARGAASQLQQAQQQHSFGRFVVKDLGSLVIGAGAPGITVDGDTDAADVAAVADKKKGRGESVEDAAAAADVGAETKTLGDIKFVVGDYVSCAILPPLANGEVAPTSSARTGRGAGPGEGRAAIALPPPARRDMRERERDNGYDRRGRGGRGTFGGFGAGRDAASVIPSGEWRRGERLPDMPGRGRGRPRW